MSKKERQNSTSVLQKANHFGMALSVFVILAGTILWLTGNLHFGPRRIAETGGILDNGGHEHGNRVIEHICTEHGVPESLCVRCNPSLAATFKAKGDWCTEHNLPESQCTFCNPDLAMWYDVRASIYLAFASNKVRCASSTFR